MFKEIITQAVEAKRYVALHNTNRCNAVRLYRSSSLPEIRRIRATMAADPMRASVELQATSANQVA
jgi:hypothetical protein